jgi:hypothetical protein
MKPVRLIKMCLSETYRKFYISIYLSDNFSTQKNLKKKKGNALSPLIFNFALEYAN